MLFIIDFDGVICNSIHECMLVAYTAFHCKNLKKIKEINNFVSVPEPIATKFKHLRFMVRHAGEYWFLIHCLLNEISITTQFDFDRLKIRYKKEIDEFENLFFAARHQVRKYDPEYWLSNHSIYPEFKDSWNKIKNRFEVFIVTMKDYESVKLLLEYNRIRIEQDRIFARDHGLSKSNTIIKIVESRNQTVNNVICVDDHLKQLKQVSTIGVQCFYASWGYCDPRNKVPSSIHKVQSINDILDYLELQENSSHEK